MPLPSELLHGISAHDARGKGDWKGKEEILKRQRQLGGPGAPQGGTEGVD